MPSAAPVASNAEGARLAGQRPALAGIASERAAQRVRPAHRGAGDPGRRPQPHPLRDRHAYPDRHPQPQASGHDCTSLVVSVANRPGAVHDMLVPLKQHGVSMTRFESRPARSGQWEYYFYIDLQGHPDAAARRRRAGRSCASVCAFFKLLGTYPVDVH